MAIEKLTIYRVKDDLKADAGKIKSFEREEHVDIPGATASLYLRGKDFSEPKWVGFLRSAFEVNFDTEYRNISAVLRLVVDGIHYVIPFGQSSKAMYDEEDMVDDFGLRVCLNSVDPNSIRQINKRTIGPLANSRLSK